MSNKELGKVGETKAARFLVHQGYQILEKNYRFRLGEIDIVAQYKSQLIFVEVKTRRSRVFSGLLSIDDNKQRKIVSTAEHYQMTKKMIDWQPRFDIICVYFEKGEWDFEHFPNSFSIFY
ncbi:MAG: YraN family protein [SAR324 cluster bacterium]|nr:YraN family protein [SAR324 cluster bacterium]